MSDAKNIDEPFYSNDGIFLPVEVIRMVFKTAKIFEMSSVDEFSILETLLQAILKNIEELDEILDEKSISVFLLNIIRITDKFNCACSTINDQAKLEEFLSGTGVTVDELNKYELEVFKSLNFEVLQSPTVDLIFKLITNHLPEQEKKKNDLFEIAMDVLRVVYLNAPAIYEEFTANFDEASREVMQSKRVLVAGVFMTTIKLLAVADRIHNQKFDAVVAQLDHPQAAAWVNKLAAILFKLIVTQ